jgi:tetratricopeptide (TPR) repeat protein
MDAKVAFTRSAGTFFILKKWEKASTEYEKIIELYGDDPMIYEQLFICYNNLRDPRAKSTLEKAIKFTTKPEKLALLKEKLNQFK